MRKNSRLSSDRCLEQKRSSDLLRTQTSVANTHIYVRNHIPPPLRIFLAQNCNWWSKWNLATANFGPIHPILYTMTVSWLLNLFLAILYFFDSYHALATLCKLENLGNLAFLAIFAPKLHILGGHSLGQKIALN